jgi:hydrogenase maturation factor HypF (carbamoyltransferase family)
MYAPLHHLLVMTEKRLLALTSAVSNLQAQLDELSELREQLEKAELSTERRPRPLSRRKIIFDTERRRLC